MVRSVALSHEIEAIPRETRLNSWPTAMTSGGALPSPSGIYPIGIASPTSSDSIKVLCPPVVPLLFPVCESDRYQSYDRFRVQAVAG